MPSAHLLPCLCGAYLVNEGPEFCVSGRSRLLLASSSSSSSSSPPCCEAKRQELLGMEKAEKPTKRRAPAADAEGLRKRAREAEEDEVEEFFATLRRMRGAVKYFERSGGDGVRRGPATLRAMLETGAELSAKGRSSKGAPEDEEPGRKRAGVIPDLNACPEENSAGD